MRIIAFITEAPAVRQILAHWGEPTSPPRLAPARGPPLWEMPDAGQGSFDHEDPLSLGGERSCLGLYQADLLRPVG